MLLTILLVTLAFTARARAAGPRSLLTRALPPAPAPPRPHGLAGTIAGFVESLKPGLPREKSEREREAALLPIRGKGLSTIGASLAGIGISTGATMSLARPRGMRLPMTLGPRFFGGGGGVGLSMRW